MAGGSHADVTHVYVGNSPVGAWNFQRNNACVGKMERQCRFYQRLYPRLREIGVGKSVSVQNLMNWSAFLPRQPCSLPWIFVPRGCKQCDYFFMKIGHWTLIYVLLTPGRVARRGIFNTKNEGCGILEMWWIGGITMVFWRNILNNFVIINNPC